MTWRDGFVILRSLMEHLLQVEELCVRFRRDGIETLPVRGVSLELAAGERLALVGESGCGKSMTCLALTALAPTDRAERTGSVRFCGRNMLALDPEDLRALRGRDGIAYVFQDPAGSLNPVMRIGDQIAECLAGPRQARISEAVRLLTRVGLPDPERAVCAYPCALSGGMQQRAMVAMALACRPRLLIADEPTTALDVTTQRQVLDLVDELARETGMSVLLVTHNLGLVAGRADRVAVMYAGQVVECGPVADVLRTPRHPYTLGLLAAVPRLDAPRDRPLVGIPGTVPSPDRWPAGCGFAPRCARRMDACSLPPPMAEAAAGRQTRCWLAKQAAK
ncbi:MAG: ABC transporter ATP-binding protein [bacterium]